MALASGLEVHHHIVGHVAGELDASSAKSPTCPGRGSQIITP